MGGSKARYWLAACSAVALVACGPAWAQQRDPLLDVLVQKHVISKSDAERIAATPGDQRDQLVRLLQQKGVLNAQDVGSLSPAPAAAAPVLAAPASTAPALAPATVVPPPQTPGKRTAQRPPLNDRTRLDSLRRRQVAADESSDASRSPLSFRIGGAEFTPGGFVDFETVFRSTNTGNVSGTSFGTIPFSNTIAGHLTEFRATGQYSRFSLRATDKFGPNNVTGYLEMDFNGNDPANVFVDSNSHTPRLRLYWLDLKRGQWEVLAGQTWGLQTPNRVGVGPEPKDVFVTYNEDANFNVGLPWTRHAEGRVIYHASDNLAMAFAIANPQQFVGAGEVIFPFAFNAQLATQFDTGANPGTPNVAPDLIAKAAWDSNPGGPGFHIEVGGLASFFRTATLPVGGIEFTHDTQVGGAGFAAVAVEPLSGLRFVGNAMYGTGVGRYMGGLGPDVVVMPVATALGFDAQISTVRAGTALGGIEYKPWEETTVAAYYGLAYFYRDFFLDITNPVPGRFGGFGGPNSPNSANKTVQEATLDLQQSLWHKQQYGQVRLDLQGSYVTRTPWFVPAGAPKNAHTMMGFVSLKYLLP